MPRAFRISTPRDAPFRRAGILFDRDPKTVPADHFSPGQLAELFHARDVGFLLVEEIVEPEVAVETVSDSVAASEPSKKKKGR